MDPLQTPPCCLARQTNRNVNSYSFCRWLQSTSTPVLILFHLRAQDILSSAITTFTTTHKDSPAASKTLQCRDLYAAD